MEEKIFVLHFFSAFFFNGELLDGWRGADSGNLQAIKACVASPNSFNSPLKKERISRQKSLRRMRQGKSPLLAIAHAGQSSYFCSRKRNLL